MPTVVNPYRFLGCDPDTQDLILVPERPNLLREEAYRRAIIFIEAQRQIFMGLSAFKYSHQKNCAARQLPWPVDDNYDGR